MSDQRAFTDYAWTSHDRADLHLTGAAEWIICQGHFESATHGLIVGVCIASYRGGNGYTELTMLHNGQQHRRSWPRAWHRRTIPRLARAFIADVIA